MLPDKYGDGDQTYDSQKGSPEHPASPRRIQPIQHGPHYRQKHNDELEQPERSYNDPQPAVRFERQRRRVEIQAAWSRVWRRQRLSNAATDAVHAEVRVLGELENDEAISFDDWVC